MLKKIKSKLPIILILLSAISYMLFANTTLAQNLNLDFLKGIVPCGTRANPAMCTVCDFFKLIQNIINFLLFVAAPLVTLGAIYIAFIFLFSGGSSKLIQDARSKIGFLIWGVVWVFGSWLVLNTILNVVANPAAFPWPWNKVQCSVTTSLSNSSEGVPWGYSGVSLSDAVRSAAIERLDSDNYEFGGSATGGGVSGSWEDGVQVDTSGYQALDSEHIGLEQVEPSPPFSQTQIVNPVIDPIVKQAETRGIDPNLVKAIIQAESSGNPNAIHVDKDGKASYGLMQVRPDTARRYDIDLAGLTDAQIGEKLKDPNYSIKLGTAYLQDLSIKYGSSLDKVIAAYNGGPGANGPSVDCPGSLRWQCQWDNKAQTIPNKGYEVTRNYVQRVNNYYSQLSK